MAETLENRLEREYGEYTRKETAAGREPISQHRWEFRRLGEMETEKAAPPAKPKKTTTKREAKRTAASPEYMRYRRERVSKGRPFLSNRAWLRSRGE